MASFDGKVALVTGAGSGMGRAIALRFAEVGAKVAVADFREETGQETVKLITDTGGEAIFLATDVANVGAVRRMVELTVAQFGALHYAVNNAGIIHEFVPLAEISEETYDRVMGVNAKGVYFGMAAEIPAILAAGGGAIVNISSVDGHTAQAGLSAYVASKHAVHGMTRAAALDYGGTSLRINAIAPGAIATNIAQNSLTPEELQAMMARSGAPAEAGQPATLAPLIHAGNATPAGRYGRPEEIAYAAVWLCSDEASYVNGAILPVDGGFSVI